MLPRRSSVIFFAGAKTNTGNYAALNSLTSSCNVFRVAEDHGRVDTGRVVRKQHDRAAIAVLDKTLFAVTVDKPFR